MLLRVCAHSLIVAVIGLVWEGLSGGLVDGFGPLNPVLFGRPSRVVGQLGALVLDPVFWPHLWITLSETLMGLAWALFAAVFLALLFVYRPLLGRLLEPWLNGINALPKLALAPFLVVWVGIGFTSKVLVSASMAFFPLFFSTLSGVRALDPELINAHRIMGFSKLQLLRVVVFPCAWRWTLSAGRAALGLALTGAVVGEFIGATGGLGYLLVGAQGFMATDRALAILVVLGVLGVGLDWAIHWLQGKSQFSFFQDAL